MDIGSLQQMQGYQLSGMMVREHRGKMPVYFKGKLPNHQNNDIGGVDEEQMK